MDEKVNVEIQEEQSNGTNTATIYQTNKKTNKEKLLFFNFLMNNTKIDIHIEEVQSYLFWVGILEFFTWIVFLSIFISSPSTMGVVWVFFYHNARGIVGLILLKFIPKTHDVIENLRDYENQSLEDIQKQMEQNYISIIHDNEKVLRPILIIYFILTILSIFIDIILFAYICANIAQAEQEAREFALLIGCLIYIVCDFVYFGLIASLRFSFPPETRGSIKKIAFGYFSELKSGIAQGFSSGYNGIVNKIKTKMAKRAVEQAVENV